MTNQKMNPFPADHELLSIFCSEPEILDADVPWFYNELTFRGNCDGLDYLVKISPADGELEIRIGQPSNPITHLSVTDVTGLLLHESHNEAVMMATFPQDSGRGILKFRLKPALSIEWPFEAT
jgi:hypothetical protein